jgi:hypothetical protein
MRHNYGEGSYPYYASIRQLEEYFVMKQPDLT